MEKFGELQLELLKKLDKKEISRIEAQYEVESYWIGALRKAVVDGDVEEGSLMAGQSVGLVSEVISVNNIINKLVKESNEAFKEVCSLLDY